MLEAAGAKNRLPAPERKLAFTLMPLADAMMQLLIFFMLSASLSTYSLLDLQAGPPVQTGAAAGAGDTPSLPELMAGTTSDGGVLWSIEPGFVIANGQRFGFDTLGMMVAALKTGADAAEGPQVLLILRKGTTVQDLVLVLEALTAGGIAQVQLVSTGEAG